MYLREGFSSNPHGAGFAYHDGTKVRIHKGFFTWSAFWSSYQSHVTAAMPAFIHFRIATSGPKIAENCHPFSLGNGALMHNGPCLNRKHCAGTVDRCDTVQFVEDFVAGLSSTQFMRLRPMIEDFAGTEKVIAMFDDGAVVICNEDEGHWAEGCWWSNDSYKKYDYSKYSWKDYLPKSEPLSMLDYVGQKLDEEMEAKPRYTYSASLKAYLPREVIVDDKPLYWGEACSAYLPDDLGDEAVCDDEYVYSDGTCQDIVSEVIRDSDHLGWYLLQVPDVPQRAIRGTINSSDESQSVGDEINRRFSAATM